MAVDRLLSRQAEADLSEGVEGVGGGPQFSRQRVRQRREEVARAMPVIVHNVRRKFLKKLSEFLPGRSQPQMIHRFDLLCLIAERCCRNEQDSSKSRSFRFIINRYNKTLTTYRIIDLH